MNRARIVLLAMIAAAAVAWAQTEASQPKQTTLKEAFAALAGEAGTDEAQRAAILQGMHPVDGDWDVEILSFDESKNEYLLELTVEGTKFRTTAWSSPEAAVAFKINHDAIGKTLSAKLSASNGTFPVEYYRLKLLSPEGTMLLGAEFLRPDGLWIEFVPLFNAMRDRMNTFSTALQDLPNAETAARLVDAYVADMAVLYDRYVKLEARFEENDPGVPPLAAQQAMQDIARANTELGAFTKNLKTFIDDPAVKEAVLKAKELAAELTGNMLYETGLEKAEIGERPPRDAPPFDPNKDYSSVVSLFEEFLAANQRFIDDAKAISDAHSAAVAIRTFSDSLGPLFARMKNVLVDNPELAGLDQPPEVLRPIFDRMNETGPQVQEAMSSIQPFIEDEEVKEAMQELYALGS